MAKKKTAQKVQLLSPENYIRQRSRNLPLHGCWINHNWLEEQAATIIVARKHVSGNVTYVIYLVDLLCLGVKQTFFGYNDLESKLDDFLEQIGEDFDIEEIAYDLAHNIIYAAIEYAEEYGFEPCLEFRQTTKYLLEEDTDDIPLIEVSCGDENGMPLYIQGEDDSLVRAKQVIAQLEKTAGEGNFHYILNDDDNEFVDVDVDKELAAIEQDLERFSEDELKERFFELMPKDSQFKPEDEEIAKQLLVMSNILVGKLIDKDILDNCYEDLEDELLVEIVEENYLPNSLFQGILDVEGDIILDMFLGVLSSIQDRTNPKKKLKEMRERLGDVPINDYLDLFSELDKHDGDISKCGEKLMECHQKYPGYFLFELYWNEYLYLVNGDEDALKRIMTLPRRIILPLTGYEYVMFMSKYVLYCSGLLDDEFSFEKLVAIEDFIQEYLPMYQPNAIGLLSTLSIMKMNQLTLYLEEERQ